MQQVWFWRDARQPDLVKIRWLGPAQVVMKERRPAEGESDGPVSVYWLAFKSQLVRCAPHHVRADVKSFNHAIDDTQTALNTVGQLRPHGVIRFYDLRRTNHQNLADVEEGEHGEGSRLTLWVRQHQLLPSKRQHHSQNRQKHRRSPRHQLLWKKAQLQRHPKSCPFRG